MQEVVFAEPPREEGACVHPRRTVWLKEHQIAVVARITRAEEVIESDLEQVGSAGVAGDVATEFAISLVGPDDHRQRVPAHQRTEAFLDREVAGECWLVRHRDGVDVRRRQLGCPPDALLTRTPEALRIASVTGSVGRHRGFESVEPFRGFLWIGMLRQHAVRRMQPSLRHVIVHCDLRLETERI